MKKILRRVLERLREGPFGKSKPRTLRWQPPGAGRGGRVGVPID
jgi:hypothetical protein